MQPDRAAAAEPWQQLEAVAGRLTARLFADAQRLGAVLLLEHAEPVVGAAAGGGAHARMTPADVRDLMRRCESYPGFVAFAVTLTRRASPAALARFDAVIQFPAGGDVGAAAAAPVAAAEPAALAPPAAAAAVV